MKLSVYSKLILSILLTFNFWACDTENQVPPTVTTQIIQNDKDFNQFVNALTKMRNRFDARMSEYKNFSDVISTEELLNF